MQQAKATAAEIFVSATAPNGKAVAAPTMAVPAPDRLVVLLGASVCVFVWAFQAIWSSLALIRPNLLLLGIALLVWFGDQNPIRRLIALTSPVYKMVLGLFLLAVISVPFSVYRSVSLRFLLTEVVILFMWMSLIALAVRTRRDISFMMAMFLAGAVVYSFFSELHGRSSRLSGIGYYDANDLALMLVCTLPIAVKFLRPPTPLWGRIVSGVALLYMVVAIMRTSSRGGFLGIVAVGAFILIAYRGIPKMTRLGVVLAAVVTLSLAADQDYWDRIRTMLNPSEDYNFSGTTNAGRGKIWKRGMGYMVSSPFGVGVQAFSAAEGASQASLTAQSTGSGFKWSAPHNSFVQIAAELGVGGAFCILGAFAAAFAGLRRVARRRKFMDPESHGDSEMALTLTACLIGFFVSGFFVSFGYSTLLYFLLGITIGFLKVARPRAAPAHVPAKANKSAMHRSRAAAPPVRTPRALPRLN
jgi:O-antigen ligase